MQLLTEVNLGFALAIQELGELRSAGRQLRRARVVEEINLLLQATYRLVRDTVSEQGEHVKSLPQVLGIVPSLFGMLADLSDDQEGAHVNTSSVHDVRFVCRSGGRALTARLRLSVLPETGRFTRVAMVLEDASVPA